MLKISVTGADFRTLCDQSVEYLCVRTLRAGEICEKLEDCKSYDVSIQERRKRRSQDANAYAWVLIGKLAAKLSISPNEVYRQYIPDVGDNYYILPIKSELVAAWDRQWCEGHDGRMIVDMGPSRALKGYNNVRTYFGSSDYDARQMSRLIDMIVQDCKEQGIETLTPCELDAMKERWACAR